MEAFILTGEGPDYKIKSLWSTHNVIGIFTTEQEARAWADATHFIVGNDDLIVLRKCHESKESY